MHFPQIHGALSVTPQAGQRPGAPSQALRASSPRGGAGEEQGDETERARLLTENHRRCDSIALTKSLPIAAQRLFPAGLALSVTFGDTSPKGRGFGIP